jgi:ribonuclease BN (tRNA processing enzyme)
VKMVRVIGCKRIKEEQSDIQSIKNINGTIIAELINMGDKINVKLNGNSEVMVEPFQCFHTVDTCGYVIYELRKRLADQIILPPGSVVEANFTEDQIKKKGKCEDPISFETKYSDIIDFSKRHNVTIIPEIVDVNVSPSFTLKRRRLTFPDGLNIQTKIDQIRPSCTLIPADFDFFKKYKIDINMDVLVPKTMFFGDTCSYIFNKKNKHVFDLLSHVENVIIESTFLEDSTEIDQEKYKDRCEKRHMFLFELIPIFEAYPNVNFLLIHFSACYDKKTIREYICKVNETCKNVKAFV